MAQTDPYLRPVVDGVPVRPDDEQAQDPTPHGPVTRVVLLVLAAVLFAVGWAVGVIVRAALWIAAAVMVGFDTGSGR